MQKLSESDALNIIKAGPPFSIQLVTADINRRTGGSRIFSDEAVVKGTNHSEIENGTITIHMKDHDKTISVHRFLIEKVNDKKVVH